MSEFINRHIGPRQHETAEMLKEIGVKTIDELIDRTIPADIRLKQLTGLPAPVSEYKYLNDLKKIATHNSIFRTYIGLGFYNTILPSVIKRNILENPAWYTTYTPYQAEISQGRLEALLNFQTVITELTGMKIANASLLDEATAAAEAMIMTFNSRTRQSVKDGAIQLIADSNLFPQTIEVLKTRAVALGIELKISDTQNILLNNKTFGVIVQYPDAFGEIRDYRQLAQQVHDAGAMLAVSADLLSLTLLTPPAEWEADIVFGSSQRFGIPMGFGGPHAAFFATRDEFKRNMPGRIIGISVDTRGNQALRMALQTREQHIKREKATSNICTAQALLANMAGMYAVYHGPDGLKDIALRIHSYTHQVATTLRRLNFHILSKNYFDTLAIKLPISISSDKIKKLAEQQEINFRYIDSSTIGLSIDETTTIADLNDIVKIFADASNQTPPVVDSVELKISLDNYFLRKNNFMQQEVFNRYHSETEMMRYIKKLGRKDISLTHSMIPLGSCTMKLNAATEMTPLSWPEFANLHPFVPPSQATGYYQLISELENFLKVITGFEAVSFQPNSGAAGELTGLLIIRQYHLHRGDPMRKLVLIPSSAHGTNPASAAMAGLDIEVVQCDERGNIRINHLQKLAETNRDRLAGVMVTYPSTHGVFESDIRKLADIIHNNGGLVYMDGANMNAQVGLTNPATIGADLCHLNLHKTFGIPHGGGGPGVGPIAVAKHLVSFLPSHPMVKTGGENSLGTVSAAPFGSASVLVISHAYCSLLGAEGLSDSTRYAILNANYLAARLKDYFKILYTGENDFVAHELILDCRPFKASAGITEGDIAKRLMDYGFHAPTVSFPVHGTLMIEPTESESLQELDRFTEAMISIFTDIQDIVSGEMDKNDNVLKNAPHCMAEVTANDWTHAYSREKATYPLDWVAENKFWPITARIDDAFGDRNLICSCK
jgi:glycine dehydrogenase